LPLGSICVSELGSRNPVVLTGSCWKFGVSFVALAKG
jgi:hypothetical protein